MLRRPRQLHLVHGMLLAEQLAALAAVDAAVGRVEALPARRLQADIVRSTGLPVLLRHDFIRIGRSGVLLDGITIVTSRLPARACRGGGGEEVLVGLEDVEPLELLVQDGQRLEALGLLHLRPEPGLDLILAVVLEVLVRVVKVSGRVLIERKFRHVETGRTCSAVAM